MSSLSSCLIFDAQHKKGVRVYISHFLCSGKGKEEGKNFGKCMHEHVWKISRHNNTTTHEKK